MSGLGMEEAVAVVGNRDMFKLLTKEWLETAKIERVVQHDGTPVNFEIADPAVPVRGARERFGGSTNSFNQVSQRMLESGGVINLGCFVSGERPEVGTLMGFRLSGQEVVMRVVEPMMGQVAKEDLSVQVVPDGRMGNDGVQPYDSELVKLPAVYENSLEVKAVRPVVMLSKPGVVK